MKDKKLNVRMSMGIPSEIRSDKHRNEKMTNEKKKDLQLKLPKE